MKEAITYIIRNCKIRRANKLKNIITISCIEQNSTTKNALLEIPPPTLVFCLCETDESFWSFGYDWGKFGRPLAIQSMLLFENLLGQFGIYAAKETGSTPWPRCFKREKNSYIPKLNQSYTFCVMTALTKNMK